MSKADYYQLLGVEKTASADEIKKSYRKLAMKYHPDRNQGDKEAEKKFKEISEAYGVLSESQKRASYEQFGHQAFEGGHGAGGPGGPGFSDFSDIFGAFSDIFGGGGGGRRASTQQRGSDLLYQLSLTLEQAIKGGEQVIQVPAWVTCKTCDGSGAEPGTSPETCPECHGSGHVTMSQGFLSIQQPCPRCHGKGKIIRHPCRTCRGQGRVQENQSIKVKIPQGVDDGDRLRVRGKGEAGVNGGPTGDLYIEIHIASHKIFERRGLDLVCEVPIDFVTASLGGTIQIPGMDGRYDLKIPKETQSGAMFRLRGKGIFSQRHGHTGDLMCRVHLETPVKLTQKQKDMLKAFQETLKDGQHAPKSTSWLQSIKNFFKDIKV